MTLRVEPKSTTPYSFPPVDPLESEDVKKAPAIVADPFIENGALLEVLSEVLVVVPVIEPSVNVCR